MKKKMIILFAFWLSFLLMGCSGDETNLSENVEKVNSSESETEKIADTDIKSTEKNEDNEQIDEIGKEPVPDAYIPILNETYNFLMGDFDEEVYMDTPYGLIGILEVTNPMGNHEEDLSSIGYKLKDINDDSIEELFISDSNNIFGLYTIKDDEAVLVTEGWKRSRNYLLSDNTIYYEGSGGAVNTTFGIYTLNSGSTELEAVDVYFSDYIDEVQHEIGWFYDSDDSGNINDSVLIEMTSDEVLGLRNVYRAEIVQLDLTYFINYIPLG